MSHDPALVIDGDEMGPEDLAVHVKAGTINGHRDCDLLIGRWSGALIQVTCVVGSRGDRDGSHSGHRRAGDVTIDAGWVRLALLAGQALYEAASPPDPLCFSWRVISALRDEIADGSGGFRNAVDSIVPSIAYLPRGFVCQVGPPNFARNELAYAPMMTRPAYCLKGGIRIKDAIRIDDFMCERPLMHKGPCGVLGHTFRHARHPSPASCEDIESNPEWGEY